MDLTGQEDPPSDSSEMEEGRGQKRGHPESELAESGAVGSRH